MKKSEIDRLERENLIYKVNMTLLDFREAYLFEHRIRDYTIAFRHIQIKDEDIRMGVNYE